MKGRAGGGVPPWGRQSAARNEVEELAACQITQEVAEKAKVGKFLATVVCILLHIFFGGVFGPP